MWQSWPVRKEVTSGTQVKYKQGLHPAGRRGHESGQAKCEGEKRKIFSNVIHTHALSSSPHGVLNLSPVKSK